MVGVNHLLSNTLPPMKRTFLTYCFLLVSLLIAPTAAKGQRPRRAHSTAAPQSEPSCVTAAEQRTALADREAKIEEELDEARRLFSQDTPGKEAIGKKIVELENTLFLLRGQLDSLNTILSATKAHRESVAPEPDATSEGGKVMIVENEYFSDNLSGNDYGALVRAQNDEPRIDSMLGVLKDNYNRLSALISLYYAAEKGAQADSIYSRIDRVNAENHIIAASIGKVWKQIFDTKIYTYNYILDKCGEKEFLEAQERQMNNLMLLQSEIEGEYMYEEAAQYALQKLLITGYEQRIADTAGLREAADSLCSLIPPTSHIEDYFLPPLDTRERMFYDFADAEIYRPAKYTSSAQIPQVEIFPRGVIFRVLLGVYSKAQPVSVFKGVYPLSHEVKTDRQHYYYAGGYRTHSETQEAAARLKRYGFRNPRVVVWRDGVYYGNPTAEESSVPENTKTQKDRVGYRVEIAGAGEGLSRVVRDVIERQAAGKEISRTADSSDGSPVFVIGVFNTEALASSLVNEIEAVEPELTLTVAKIP